ncbi:MAG: ArsR family transcriptional regulator [Promethearchaeota archaeon]
MNKPPKRPKHLNTLVPIYILIIEWWLDLSKELDNKEIIGSLDSISKLAKAIAHPKRLQLLSLLLDKSLDFSTLIDKTNLKKTALSNHLSQLLTHHLVEKYGRGSYHITTDGRDLLKAMTTVYKDSRSREQLEREKLRRRYSNMMVKRMKKTENLVSHEPTIQRAWISYLGAVLGVLQSLGKEKEIDMVSVGGYTGYAFALPNVMKGVTCPSGPTALAIWEDIVNSTGNLGFRVHRYINDGSYPTSDEVTDDDRERAKELFELVKSSIDNDKPVVLWGLDVIEYCIVKGYTRDSYIASTTVNRPDTPIQIRRPDTPIHYDDLHAPGSLHAIFFEEEAPDISEDVDKEAVHRAIKFSEGTLVYDQYVAGSSAYDEWAECLESEIEDDHPYHGNSYNGECVLEAKRIAQIFTKRLSEKYQGRPQAKYLDEASQKFFEIVKWLAKFQRIFPFALEGAMPREKLIEGAEILRATKPFEIEALAHLKESYEAWA